MEKELRTIGNQLVLISGAVCGLVFLTGLLRGRGLLEMLKTSIALAVAAVPEGLPTVATTTLALGIRDMRRHKVLIRHLDAVETLGAVQTICLDKTGTITMNRMTVVAVYAGDKRFQVSEGVFLREGKYVNAHAVEELLRLIHISVLCNETEVSMQEGEYVLRGSSTENALIHMAVHAGVDGLALRRRFPLLQVTHRSENRNFMMTVHEFLSEGRLTAVKGSPIEVLAMCRWHIKDGKVETLNEEDRLSIETENERMAGEALRVLGVAYMQVRDGDEEEDGFTWLGLAGMADPTRKGVKELIEVFHRAGIDTVMITGDQSPTAYAVGRSLDLSNGGQLEILDSTHLASIEPEVIRALCERVHVFSRVSPAHKLQIVQALQGAGKVVAMTGDGINDGPALKAADIGIAMGTTGTDVAREIADVVLEDDNLETMVIAIGRGRTIYGNIRKSVHFLLATNMSEIMVTFTAMAAGMGQPLSAMQLLWINLMSDIVPGLALALEPPEPDVMSRPPRNPREPILKAADFKRLAFESAVLSAGALGAYGYGIMRYGRGPAASTMAFMSLTVGQLLHSISCRSERHGIFDRGNLPPNRYLNAALGGSLALQVLAAAVPGIRGLLGIAPLGLLDYAVAGGAAALPLLVNEATKKKAGGEGR
jgi:Ca2+-transporting ATPase